MDTIFQEDMKDTIFQAGTKGMKGMKDIWFIFERGIKDMKDR